MRLNKDRVLATFAVATRTPMCLPRRHVLLVPMGLTLTPVLPFVVLAVPPITTLQRMGVLVLVRTGMLSMHCAMSAAIGASIPLAIQLVFAPQVVGRKFTQLVPISMNV